MLAEQWYQVSRGKAAFYRVPQGCAFREVVKERVPKCNKPD
jgi:hypothetical protein